MLDIIPFISVNPKISIFIFAIKYQAVNLPFYL